MKNSPLLPLLFCGVVLSAALACNEKPKGGGAPPPDKLAVALKKQREEAAKKKPTADDPGSWIAAGELYNREAPIPSQCYTRTEGVNNPCYVCHQTYDQKRPNQTRDGFQQGSYAFSNIGRTNSWKNLFADRTKQVAAISDAAILEYISEDNYTPFIEWQKSDAWKGVVLELKNLEKAGEAFGDLGLAKDGSRWVAYNYKPFPSTFWPTNGATDDTMIRLAEPFSSKDGKFVRDVYYANLSLVEMAITDVQQLSTPPLDENAIGEDIDGDGKLSKGATKIVRRKTYLGDAEKTELSRMLYPKGTEFLHTVRYIGVDPDGGIRPSVRMKEVRYMNKLKFMSPAEVKAVYYNERKEKFKEKLPQHIYREDKGSSNRMGWEVLAFIEDESGKLRRQHPEEEFFCMGCHKSVGATIDQTFSFPRKVAGARGWKYIDLKDMKDAPNVGEEKGEILTYFERAGGGDEFRQNSEMLEKWFKEDGQVDAEKVKAADNLYELLAPSKERALLLNKSYLVTVKEQSFIFGRDAVSSPATNVFEKIETEDPPLQEEHRYKWDLRLDWAKVDGS